MKRINLAIFYGFGVIAVMLFVSCTKQELIKPAESVSINTLQKAESVSANAIGYTEYAVNQPLAVKGTNLFFKVSLSSTANQYTVLAVKFTPPIGSPVYVSMTYNALINSYTLTRALSLYGDYQYQYVFASNNTPLSGVTRTLTVLHTPIALGNNYPYATSSANQIDKWNMYTKNCTSWAAWKVNEMWGTVTTFKNVMNGVTLSNAKNWNTKLAQLGYPVSSVPRAGDIAQWTGYPASSTFGHVAFVNSVDASGNVTITEYNYISYSYGTRTLAVGSLWYPPNFIHVQNPL